MKKMQVFRMALLPLLISTVSLCGFSQNAGTQGIDFDNWIDSTGCPEKLRTYSLAEFDAAKIDADVQALFRSLVPKKAPGRPGSTGTSLAIFGKTVSVSGSDKEIPGLVTSGSIVLQSLQPSDPDTLNYTHTKGTSYTKSNSLFSISSWNQKPDSLIFWAKRTGSETAKARVQVLTVNPSTSYPMSTDIKSFYGDTALYRKLYGDRAAKYYQNQMSRAVEVEIDAKDGEWKRYSVPFDIIDESISGDVACRLAHVSITNGSGMAGDTLFIDDMQMVVGPVASSVSVDKAMVINGTSGNGFDTLTVSVSGIKGSFNYLEGESNVFVVELSDASGLFEAPRVLGEFRVADIAKNLSWKIAVPSDVPSGDFYAVRVRSTNPDAFLGTSRQFRIKKEYAALPQIPHSDFELWQNEGMEEVEPLGWHSYYTAKTTTLTAFGLGQRIRLSLDVRPGSQGKNSAQIWSSWTLVAAANGNLTTGKINMGSAFPPTDITKNYNFSDMTDPGHALPFTSRPDSLTFWIKYLPADSAKEYQGKEYLRQEDMRAAVTAIIHDGNGYQDPNNDTLGTGIEKNVVAKAQKLVPATNGEWVRYSVPFIYTENTNGKYMLISATTNIIPAAGVTGASTHADSVWIDDILLVYRPEVSVELPLANIPAEAATVDFKAVLDGTFNPSNFETMGDSNMLLIEIDTARDFSHAVVVYEAQAGAGIVEASFPTDMLKEGTAYFVRARTTNYPAVSEPVQLHVLDARKIFVATASTEGSDRATAAVYRNCETTPLSQDTVVNVHDTLTFVYTLSGDDERFEGWYENGLIVSEEDTLKIYDAVRDYHLVANFVPAKAVLTLTLEKEHPMDTVIATYAESGDTIYDLGKVRIPSEIRLAARTIERFASYRTVGGEELSRNEIFTFTMVGDTVIVALFAPGVANETAERYGISVYPNPVRNTLHVEGEELLRMEIFALAGQKIREVDLRAGRTVDVHALPKGMYLYRIVTADGKLAGGKFIRL